jgi:phosphomannomutase
MLLALCQVDVFGLATTPCMFYSILAEGYTGAVMLTASHMPWNANGLKFFTAVGACADLLLHGATSAP